MTDHSKDPLGDPFDLLRAHVRTVALLEQPTIDADELVADITGSIDRADRSRGAQVLPLHGFPRARSPRRRRWFVAGAAATIVAVGGAGVAAYVALRPTDPVLGIVCRESADFGSFSVVLPLEGDPVAACANLWKTDAKGEVPDLIACAGGAGSVQVFPVVDETSCEFFGFASLDPSAVVDPIQQLNAAVRESNEKCRTAGELSQEAAEVIERLGLTTWTVDVQSPDVGCSLLAVDTDAEVLIVRMDPLRPTSSEEMP
jgi:hypothetical protein